MSVSPIARTGHEAAAASAAPTPVLAIAGRRVATLLTAGALTLGALHLISIAALQRGEGRNRGGIHWFVSMDAEGNLPAWYAVTLLSLCAGLLGVVAVVARSGAAPRWPQWGLLSLLFLGLSFDEFASLHERTSEPLQRLFGTSGFLHYAWVIGMGAGVLVFAASYIGFLRSLPAPTSRGLIVAGVLYVTGAIGMEMMEAAMFAQTGSHTTLAYGLLVLVEEMLEMLGLILLMRTVIDYLVRVAPTVRLEFTSAGGAPAPPVPPARLERR